MKMVAPLEVGICCRDLDRLAEFYTRFLGCERVTDLEVPAEKARPSALSDGAYRVLRLQTPWGERLKLLQPAAPPEAAARTPWVLGGQGIVYLTFIVEDLRATIARLSEAGADFLTGDAPVEVRPQTFLAFLRDPEGNVLEFVEYGSLSDYRSDLA
ncbi:MAG: VOC family protein [Tistlia sp.]